jgi:hypothetical protein
MARPVPPPRPMDEWMDGWTDGHWPLTRLGDAGRDSSKITLSFAAVATAAPLRSVPLRNAGYLK